MIHRQGIHVLVDLSGHTAHNRLPVFSYRPAPVQASWLGYFATTGLPEMDYFLGDPYTVTRIRTTPFLGANLESARNMVMSCATEPANSDFAAPSSKEWVCHLWQL